MAPLLMMIELPIGDVVDRATILELKLEHLARGAAWDNCRRQLNAIERAWVGRPMRALPEYAALLEVNRKLWTLEDTLRSHEKQRRFDGDFIESARAVYRNNDERASIKRALDERLGSSLLEVKLYSHYD